MCQDLNKFEHFFAFVSVINGCLSISAFPELGGLPLGIASAPVGVKPFAITPGIKKYKSLWKEEKTW